MTSAFFSLCSLPLLFVQHIFLRAQYAAILDGEDSREMNETVISEPCPTRGYELLRRRVELMRSELLSIKKNILKPEYHANSDVK